MNLQNWKAVAGEVLDLLIPARLGEGRWVAPRVIVEGEEITTLVIGTAVHVLSHLHAVLGHISSGISNRDLAVSTASQVLSHVTGNSLDVLGSGGRSSIVDDFVGGEECKSVGVAGEGINGSKNILKVYGVVRWCWVGPVDGVERAIYIEDKVDAGICEGLHANIVVGGVVDGVDTDGVHSQLLELGNVTLAGCGLRNGVDKVGGSTGLPIDTPDVEPAGSSKESFVRC
jgi:hypothetical protein